MGEGKNLEDSRMPAFQMVRVHKGQCVLKRIPNKIRKRPGQLRLCVYKWTGSRSEPVEQFRFRVIGKYERMDAARSDMHWG